MARVISRDQGSAQAADRIGPSLLSVGVDLATLLSVGIVHVLKVAAPAAGSCTLVQISAGPPPLEFPNGYYLMAALTGTSAGRVATVTSYDQATEIVTYQGSIGTLDADDLVMLTWGPPQPAFTKVVRTIAARPYATGVVADSSGEQDKTAAQTTQSLTYEVLDIVDLGDHGFPTNQNALIAAWFDPLKWKSAVADGGGPVTGTTKWVIIHDTTTVAGDALPGGAVDLTDEQAAVLAETTHSRVGMFNTAALGGEPYRLALAGKVDDVNDTLSAKIVDSTEIPASIDTIAS